MFKKITLSLLVATSLFAETPKSLRESLMSGPEFISLSPTVTALTSFSFGAQASGDIYQLGLNCKSRNGALMTSITDPFGTHDIDLLSPEYDALPKKDRDWAVAPGYTCIDKTNKQSLFKAKRMTGGSFAMANGFFTDYHWIIEHLPEPMLDKGSFFTLSDQNFFGWPVSSEDSSDKNRIKFSSKYPTFESFFDDFMKAKLQAPGAGKVVRNGNYAFAGVKIFSFDSTYEGKFMLSPSMTPALSEVRYFCEGHKGNFLKDGKPFLNTVEAFVRDGAQYAKRENYFNGKYACTGGNVPFNVTVNGSQMVVKKDVPADFFATIATPSTSIIATGYTPSMPTNNTPQNAMVSAGNEEDAIAKQAAAMKMPFGKQTGAINYIGLYNGVDSQGCDLVSVIKKVNNSKTKDTFNYKSCNGTLTALGETGLPGMPRKSELDPVVDMVKKTCKEYGAYGTQYQNTIVSCKSLDINHCNLEITIMQDNKLLNKQVVNSCK